MQFSHYCWSKANLINTPGSFLLESRIPVFYCNRSFRSRQKPEFTYRQLWLLESSRNLLCCVGKMKQCLLRDFLFPVKLKV